LTHSALFIPKNKGIILLEHLALHWIQIAKLSNQNIFQWRTVKKLGAKFLDFLKELYHCSSRKQN